MPPVKKRARTYNPARIRAAVRAQFGNVREGVSTLTPEHLALPTRLGEWSVRELVAHIGTALDVVGRNLDRPAPAKAEVTVLDWPFGTSANSGDIADTARQLAERNPDPVAHLAGVGERFAERLALHPAGTRLLATGTGAMSLDDYLVTRTVELVVHTDDLNTAVPGLDIPFDRQALAACTRLLADALAVKAPGASTEVRIPPYAVVQCVEGPRHTRGTPPNVVETDPLTWIRLATGRTEWKTALDEAKVSASGERADLAKLLPLMG
ncbi:maleylpyruvate isomerase family mycothiol-dependent enzyme [Streptomyces rhizosphaerihabitans]|uniref:maleylpyruvate isomerase family mycothiol-dependent enzyme n=1 Tax=Streptomyces rhizosphaerihabitans TaxID=1266770 RepID=UPI0021BFF37A|nr:maleylpyruvate isomerase family mycothiol-dependent enzyme [Streptomyces rhizosphaerihabitans]MCT9010410.1 maleylpyruvate isomerase family mycothiol-dependent enzyme [Streptomyces rhizosphaerihabitans]